MYLSVDGGLKSPKSCESLTFFKILPNKQVSHIGAREVWQQETILANIRMII